MSDLMPLDDDELACVRGGFDFGDVVSNVKNTVVNGWKAAHNGAANVANIAKNVSVFQNVLPDVPRFPGNPLGQATGGHPERVLSLVLASVLPNLH
jgi:hypothetical protein